MGLADWDRGLTVTPAFSLTNQSVMSGAAIEHVGEAVAFAKAINATGFMLDYEPATSEPAWAMAYAKFVAAFTAAMHGAGLTAEMCVSSWGTSLSGPISTVLTILSWICAGICMCGTLPSPVCA